MTDSLGRLLPPKVICPMCYYPGRLVHGKVRWFVRHSGTTLRRPFYRYCWLTDEQAEKAERVTEEQV